MGPSVANMPVLSVTSVLCWIPLPLFVYLLTSSLRNLYFHPLSKFPGPKLAAISNLPYLYWTCSGKLHSKLKELHDKYGNTIRIGPSRLTYRTPQAWRDIFGHRKHETGTFGKDQEFYRPAPTGNTIITSNDADHVRQRRLLLPAFSEKALRDQESLVHSYVDLLVDRLKGEIATSRATVDMTRWYNYTTFDIIGDLAFGEPFDCLRNSRYHPWVSFVFDSVKASTLMRAALVYPCLASLAKIMVPRSMMRKRIAHYEMSKEKVNRRLQKKTDRPDFTTYILRYSDERAMTQKEVEANAGILILAGSETTATTLAAATFYLLKNPVVHRKLIEEVRGTFTTQDDINFLSVARLPYLNGVIEESLRLFPPVPGITPRQVPEGGEFIDGEFVPGGTSVSVGYYSTFRASSNFADAESFIPERWLEGRDIKFESDNRECLQPFSYGPRNCIGKNLAYAEMRLILAKVVWNFDMGLRSDSYDWDDQDSYTVWQKKPLMVILRPVQR